MKDLEAVYCTICQSRVDYNSQPSAKFRAKLTKGCECLRNTIESIPVYMFTQFFIVPYHVVIDCNYYVCIIIPLLLHTTVFEQFSKRADIVAGLPASAMEGVVKRRA